MPRVPKQGLQLRPVPCGIRLSCLTRPEFSMSHMHDAPHSDVIHSQGEHTTGGGHASHDRHAGHSVAMFRDKFWLSFALTIPVVVWSSDVQHWLKYTAPSFPGSKWIPAIFGTIVFAYGGIVFLRGAWGELADRKPGMMTLISLGILVAFGASLAATFGLFQVEVWWELATLITIMVLGHWLEMRAIAQARGALNALAALLPDTAERLSGSEVQTVPISQLRVGDVVLIRPGTRVPADAEVIEGDAEVDESMITGESKPVAKSRGMKVIAGTVASGGSLRARITAVGDQTALSGIMRLVAAAHASGSRTQALADRAAALLFYVALAAGAATFVYWWFSGDREHALIRTATVLIIACPHALGLAIPLVIAISTSLGAQNGLLVKDRLALERARNLDVIVFDKTGTLSRCCRRNGFRTFIGQSHRRRSETTRAYAACSERIRSAAGSRRASSCRRHNSRGWRAASSVGTKRSAFPRDSEGCSRLGRRGQNGALCDRRRRCTWRVRCRR